MKKPNPQTVRVVKKADKETLLRTFVADYLKRLDSAEIVKPEDRQVTCILRSASSPATKVLKSLKTDLASANMSVHVIVAKLDCDEDDIDHFEFADALHWAKNPRLIDAHEQLTLGTRFVWIGDSMRRDPETRDAFERFETDCIATLRLARQAFSRIWTVSEPVFTSSQTGAVAEIDPAELMDPKTFEQLPAEPTDRSNAATRH